MSERHRSIPSDASADGRMFADRYRLTRALGEGSFGAVYLGHDPVDDRSVAIKILHADARIDDQRARFDREIAALRSTTHPGIVRLLDAGTDEDGGLFMVMEAVEGPTLRDRIDAEDGPLPIAEAIDIAVEILRAVAAAHEAGVVHRDLKPANVMVVGRYEVRVLDFGVALLLYEPRVTRTGLGVGTIAYAAPEQALGNPEAASDQYAVGVMLYEMLAGRLPFDGNSDLQMAFAHQQLEPRALDPDLGVPAEVEALVRRALTKDATMRFASADEMADALYALRPGAPRPSDVAPTLLGESAFQPASGPTPATEIIGTADIDMVEPPSVVEPRRWRHAGLLRASAVLLLGLLLGASAETHPTGATPSMGTVSAGATEPSSIAQAPTSPPATEESPPNVPRPEPVGVSGPPAGSSAPAAEPRRMTKRKMVRLPQGRPSPDLSAPPPDAHPRPPEQMRGAQGIENLAAW